MKDGEVVGVIELKDNKTKNLDKVKDQAFGYKVNHKGCKYVITSNFQKLRFYIDDATEYEEFDLYNLDRKEFSRFYLFLRKEGLLDRNTPEKLKEETKFHEEDIGKKLYKDYSAFKYKFFDNIVKNNPPFPKVRLGLLNRLNVNTWSIKPRLREGWSGDKFSLSATEYIV